MAMATEERLQSPGLWCGSALAALAAVGRRVRPMPAPGAMGMFREAARGAGAAEQQRPPCSVVPATPCSVVPVQSIFQQLALVITR